MRWPTTPLVKNPFFYFESLFVYLLVILENRALLKGFDLPKLRSFGKFQTPGASMKWLATLSRILVAVTMEPKLVKSQKFTARRMKRPITLL